MACSPPRCRRTPSLSFVGEFVERSSASHLRPEQLLVRAGTMRSPATVVAAETAFARGHGPACPALRMRVVGIKAQHFVGGTPSVVDILLGAKQCCCRSLVGANKNDEIIRLPFSEMSSARN